MDGIGDADARREASDPVNPGARATGESAGMGDRRHERDRREGGTSQGRRGATAPTSPIVFVLRSLGAIVILMGVILYTVSSMRPVYATKGTIGDELRKHAPAVATVISPNDTASLAKFVRSPQFQEEKRNFYEDVMRLKQVDSARADSIAQYAVREAFVRGISPAIIFGVMLTENSRFVSKALSNVGAVGLMQVYPKVWLNKELSAKLGKDLATDSTNVKYGVFILSHYFNPKSKTGETTERDWATALLRYNGCVRGTNTPRCHTYPNKVQGFVEKQATSICNGRGFYECIAKPVIQGLFGEKIAPNATEAGTGSTSVPPASDDATRGAAAAAGAGAAAAVATVGIAAPATAAVPVSGPATVPSTVRAVEPSAKATAPPPTRKATPASTKARSSGRASSSRAGTRKAATPIKRSTGAAARRTTSSATKKKAAKPRAREIAVPNAPKPITIKIP